jgi:hypothetical protein
MSPERSNRDRRRAELGGNSFRVRDDEPYLNRDLRPITDEEVLDRVRELERKTGA